jgi:small subunit ribosomal protein S17
MAKQKTETKKEEKQTSAICNDVKCPFHGTLSVRGRMFAGTVVRKFPKRIAIEFERTVYIRKYERYAKSKTRLHARLPDCLANDVNVGDYVEIRECRPLSKIISFVVVKKITSGGEKK